MLTEKNRELDGISSGGDSAAIMDISKEIGKLQQEIDELFERLEIATDRDEEIVALYETKLQEIDG